MKNSSKFCIFLFLFAAAHSEFHEPNDPARIAAEKVFAENCQTLLSISNELFAAFNRLSDLEGTEKPVQNNALDIIKTKKWEEDLSFPKISLSDSSEFFQKKSQSLLDRTKKVKEKISAFQNIETPPPSHYEIAQNFLKELYEIVGTRETTLSNIKIGQLSLAQQINQLRNLRAERMAWTKSRFEIFTNNRSHLVGKTLTMTSPIETHWEGDTQITTTFENFLFKFDSLTFAFTKTEILPPKAIPGGDWAGYKINVFSIGIPPITINGTTHQVLGGKNAVPSSPDTVIVGFGPENYLSIHDTLLNPAELQFIVSSFAAFGFALFDQHTRPLLAENEVYFNPGTPNREILIKNRTIEILLLYPNEGTSFPSEINFPTLPANRITFEYSELSDVTYVKQMEIHFNDMNRPLFIWKFPVNANLTP